MVPMSRRLLLILILGLSISCVSGVVIEGSFSDSNGELRNIVLRSGHFLACLVAIQAITLVLLVYSANKDGTLRKRAAFAVLQTNLRVKAILSTMGEGLFQIDLKGKLVYLNPAAEELLGYTSEAIGIQVVHDLLHGPVERHVLCDTENCPLLRALAISESPKQQADTFVRSDGESIPVEYTCSPLTHFGDRHGTVLVFRDISLRKEMERALRDSEERYRTLVEKSRGLIYTHALDGTLISINEASAEAVGYSVDELVGTNIRDLLAPAFQPKIDWYLKAISEWGAHSGFMRVITKEGSELVWAYSNRLIHEPEGDPYVLANAHDVTAQILAEEELKSNGDKLEMALQAERREARLDFLTGIPNRRTFYQDVESEAHRARRYGRPLTLAYIDVDNFKSMNDLFGHAKGDEVLKQVAGTIHSNIRVTDTAARLGGDEFAVLLPETDSQAADVVVSKIRSLLEQERSDRAWPISFSIGVVTFEKTLGSTQDMINKADELMYEVKRQGKNSMLLVTNPH
jgi:diguanylate cyclase (GGDEF)-like protein/PAS domain S-box-containing protein